MNEEKQGPYYNPEKYGLTLIGEVSWIPESYEYDLLVVWKDNKTGQILFAQDDGCSCYVAFEETTKKHLHKMNRPQDFIGFVQKLYDKKINRKYADEEYIELARVKSGELLMKMRMTP